MAHRSLAAGKHDAKAAVRRFIGLHPALQDALKGSAEGAGHFVEGEGSRVVPALALLLYHQGNENPQTGGGERPAQQEGAQ
jgi:hypothetical protein